MGSINVDSSSSSSSSSSSYMFNQLLPTAVDQIAGGEGPEAIWAAVPISPTGIEAGYWNITYQQFANAINSVAWWLEEELGRRDGTTEPLAYFGTGGSDIGYIILLIAAVKAGYYTLFNSPRNSIDAHISLFKVQNCHTMIVPEVQPPYVAPLLAAHPMRVLRFPELKGLLHGRVSHYPYRKSFQEGYRDPLVSVHTSGSTGFPKPRTITLGCAVTMANVYNSPAVDGVKYVTTLYRDQFLLSALPMFHAAGMLINIIGVIYCRQKTAFPPPQGPPLTTEAAIALIKCTQVTAAVLPPSTLNDIGKDPNLLEVLGTLKYVFPAGGAISKAAGDAITKKTTLLNILGTTELGTLLGLEVDRKDWAYVRPSVDAGVEFRHVSDDGYEMIVVRDERLKGLQPTFETFPDLQEFSTHDLFSKHPIKPDHWLYRGRSDDVIVFLNGEKTNPTLMEGLVQSHPDVRSALVVGQNRFEAALLIEPSQHHSKLSASDRAELIENLWPVLDEANRKSPAYARVSKSHILFTSPEKPMSRAGKGTVQRGFTIEKYSAEIDALYADAETINDRGVLAKVDRLNMKQSVRQIVTFVMGLQHLGFDDDFFSRGMDSLQAIQTARYLRSGLQEAGMKFEALATSTIYTNPTITQLASTVESFEQQNQATRESAERARINDMQEILKKYSSDLSSLIPAYLETVVVLTGSTGALGSYLLEAFYKSELVSKIYCLNRSTDSQQRQETSSASRGLTSQWTPPERVTFLTSNYSKPDLGLPQETFYEIRNHATIIVHNAWQVDFNLSLSSYEHTHIMGVRNLIALSAQSLHRAKIFFISSIASVMAYHHHHHLTRPVPEEIIADFSVPQQMGYAESKHVSERLLDHACTELDIPISICRVGQVAGPILHDDDACHGMWNKQEWLPSLIISSKQLGLIPESLGVMEEITWIPIDLLSSIIYQLAMIKPPPPPYSTSSSSSSNGRRANVYHTVNPSATTWSAILPDVQAELSIDGKEKLKIVTLVEWVRRLRASSAGSTVAQDFSVNPALKLLDFYEGLAYVSEDTTPPPARLETVKTEGQCALLTQVGPVKGDWMRKWIRQWGILN